MPFVCYNTASASPSMAGVAEWEEVQVEVRSCRCSLCAAARIDRLAFCPMFCKQVILSLSELVLPLSQHAPAYIRGYLVELIDAVYCNAARAISDSASVKLGQGSGTDMRAGMFSLACI